MKCEFCNNEFSDTVLPLHLERCEKRKPESEKKSDIEQIKEKADSLGITYAQNVSKSKLEKLIEEAEK